MRMTVPVREKDGNRVSVRAIPNDRDAVHLGQYQWATTGHSC